VLLSDLVDKNGEIRMNLEWRFGIYLYVDGRYNEAEASFTEVVERRKKVLGSEHLDTLASMANLASTYRDQGRWKEAEDLDVQVIETRKRVLGSEHPSTLTSMNNLAFTWKEQGRDTDAFRLMEQCVQLRVRTLGVEHPDTLSSATALIAWMGDDLDTIASGINTL
jgi:hypothetical protein